MMKAVCWVMVVAFFAAIGVGCGKSEEAGRPEPPPVSTEPGPGMRENAGEQSPGGGPQQRVPQAPNTDDSPSNLRGYQEPKYQDPLEEDGG